MIIIFTIYAKFSLFDDDSKCFSGIAFDGCQYYLTAKTDQEITVLNKDFEPIECIATCRPYTGLCYDSSENCFWAVSQQYESQVFKLDCRLQELGSVEIYSECRYSGILSGISYCCRTDCLIVSTTSNLILVDKHCGSARVVNEAGGTSYFNGVLCVEPYFLAIAIESSVAALELVSYDGKTIEGQCLPLGCLPEAGLLCPYCDEQTEAHIYLLACNDRGCPYILDLQLEESLSSMLCGCNEESREGSCEDCTPDCCCEECTPDCSCEECTPDCCCGDCIPDCCCEDCTPDCCCEDCTPDCCCEDCTPDCCCEDCTPGCCCEDCIRELLRIIEPIKETMIHLTHMEQVLRGKLEALSQCCEYCNEPLCPDSDPCPCPCEECAEITPCEVDGGVVD